SLHNQKSQHISEICSLVQSSQTMTDTVFKNKIKSLFKIKHAPAFGIMDNKSACGEIKNLVICCQALNEKKQSPIIVTMHLENILRCNSKTVSNIATESIQREVLML
ncbi:23947_t:CDS:2, partial [Gigaspora margarita]